MNPKLKIYGPIGGDSDDAITVKTIDSQLDAIGAVDEIDVLINSDGGSVSQGLGIVKLLRDHPAKIHTIVQGSAASIAGYIACCGDRRTIEKDSIFHIHGPHVGTEGNLSDHEQSVELLHAATKAMAGRYSELSGKTSDEITEEFKVDKYYTPEQAVEIGYMTEIGNASPIAAFINTEKFSVPESFRPALARRSEPQPKKDTEMSKNPASLKELKAKFKGASAEFLLNHALSESSLEEVNAAYIDDLEAKNNEAKKEIAKLKAAVEEDEEEVVAMEEEEKPAVASEEMEILKAIKAMIEEAAGMEDEEEEVVAMEDEDEEMVAMEEEDDEAVAMNDDELKAMDDEEEKVAANSAMIQKIAAMLTQPKQKQQHKPKAKASNRRSGKGRKRSGANAVRKSTASASRTATLSAVQQVQNLAQARVKETGEAKHVATRAVLKSNPRLHDRMLAEVKN